MVLKIWQNELSSRTFKDKRVRVQSPSDLKAEVVDCSSQNDLSSRTFKDKRVRVQGPLDLKVEVEDCCLARLGSQSPYKSM